jgi:hypothetical protein
VVDEDALAEKLAVLRPHLNERQWRLLLGAEAVAIGRGGDRGGGTGFGCGAGDGAGRCGGGP